jgi:REP element-mobilizing transposase RayT
MSINKYNPDSHNRKSIRLSGYNYAQEGLYFITLCVQDRENIFGSISNGILTLNTIGKIAQKEWLNTIEVRDNVELHEFIIMPNHIHGIVEITKDKSKTEDNIGFKSPTQTIGAIVRGYKIATIKQIKEYIAHIDSKSEYSKGELQFAPKNQTIQSKSEYSKGESSKGEYSKGELQFAPKNQTIQSKSEYSKGESSKGELQFAPTAPTAPTAQTINTIKILDYKIWQRNYYEHIIKDEPAYQNISNYILTNPEKWYDDKFHK